MKNLQSSTEDKATGAVLQVGSFGLGAEAPTIPANDANQIVGYNGFVSGAGAPGTNWVNVYGPMLVMRRISAVAQVQVLIAKHLKYHQKKILISHAQKTTGSGSP